MPPFLQKNRQEGRRQAGVVSGKMRQLLWGCRIGYNQGIFGISASSGEWTVWKVLRRIDRISSGKSSQIFINAPVHGCRLGISGENRFHDNRHTWVSTLVQNGAGPYELQEMGSWQSAEMVNDVFTYAGQIQEKRENRFRCLGLVCHKNLSQ